VILARDELARAAPGTETAVTVGVFDGVHRGHLFLLNRLQEQARALGLAGGVVTLHPAPIQVLHPEKRIAYLCSLEERIELLRDAGVDFVAPVTFTSELAQLSARDFVQILVEELRVRFMLEGPDHALGRGREGTVAVLDKLGREMGYRLDVLEALKEGELVVSSTAIRSALAAGEMRRVAELLGRPLSLRGPVVEGARRGKSIGFPTANIAVGADRALPPFGVYVTWAYLGEARHKSVTNIGRRPTFDKGERTIEVYLLDYQGDDFYGRDLRIDLLERLRPERRFASADELRTQIQRDVAAARAALREG
jgi:riboflavin kinase/FMN adenylyltransferase